MLNIRTTKLLFFRNFSHDLKPLAARACRLVHKRSHAKSKYTRNRALAGKLLPKQGPNSNVKINNIRLAGCTSFIQLIFVIIAMKS